MSEVQSHQYAELAEPMNGNAHEGEHAEEHEAPVVVPWRRWVTLALTWVCAAVCAGFLPGQAVLQGLLAEHGVYATLCKSETASSSDGSKANTEGEGRTESGLESSGGENGGKWSFGRSTGGPGGLWAGLVPAPPRPMGRRLELSPLEGKHYCDHQYLALSATFAYAQFACMAIFAIVGLFFDRYGARMVATTGAVMVAVGGALCLIPIYGAEVGMDAYTSPVLFWAILITDCGSLFNSFCLFGLIWHFPSHQGLILSLSSATYQVSAVVPLGFQYAMVQWGWTLFQCFELFTAIILLAVPVCAVCVPTQADFYKEAKRVLGIPLPKPQKRLDVAQKLRSACDVLSRDWREHVALNVTLSFGFMFFSYYSILIGPFATRLFNNDQAKDELPNMLVMINASVGLIMAPLMGRITDVVGLRLLAIVFTLLLITDLCTFWIASYRAQAVCMACGCLFNGLYNMFISKYIMLYVPPNRLGTAQGVFILGMMAIMIPVMMAGQVLILTLHGHDKYVVALGVFAAAGVVTNAAFSCRFWQHPPPTTPVLLEQDEHEIARGFGCATLEEVMRVTHLTDRAVLMRKLASSNPADMRWLVGRINAEELMMLMMDKDPEELAAMLDDGDDGDAIEIDDASDIEEELEPTNIDTQPLIASAPTAGPTDPSSDPYPPSLPPTDVEPAKSNDAPQEDKPVEGVSLEAGTAQTAASPTVTDLATTMKGDVRRGDVVAVRKFFMELDVELQWEVMCHLGESMSSAEEKEFDAQFNKVLTRRAWAAMLRERKELKVLVARFMKREMAKTKAKLLRRKK